MALPVSRQLQANEFSVGETISVEETVPWAIVPVCCQPTHKRPNKHTQIERESLLQDMSADSLETVRLFVLLTRRQALPAGTSGSYDNTHKNSQQI